MTSLYSPVQDCSAIVIYIDETKLMTGLWQLEGAFMPIGLNAFELLVNIL